MAPWSRPALPWAELGVGVLLPKLQPTGLPGPGLQSQGSEQGIWQQAAAGLFEGQLSFPPNSGMLQPPWRAAALSRRGVGACMCVCECVCVSKHCGHVTTESVSALCGMYSSVSMRVSTGVRRRRAGAGRPEPE